MPLAIHRQLHFRLLLADWEALLASMNLLNSWYSAKVSSLNTGIVSSGVPCSLWVLLFRFEPLEEDVRIRFGGASLELLAGFGPGNRCFDSGVPGLTVGFGEPDPPLSNFGVGGKVLGVGGSRLVFA